MRLRSGGSEPAIAAALWATVYAAVGLTGERLSTQVLEVQWQLVPLDVLRAHPFRSVWNLHVQPPLWNLLVGCIDRWSPLSLALSMQVVMVVSGCVLAACIASVLRTLGLTRGPVLVLTAIATLNGSILLTAFRPQYELPVAAMLAGLVLLATRAPGVRSGRVLVLTSLTVTALVLTRSLYHPVLIPVVLALVGWIHRERIGRRAVVAALVIPLTLVGGWVVKNEVLFGRPTLASWDGMNLLRSVAPAVDEDELDAMRTNGEIDLPEGSFLSLDDYEGTMPPCTPAHDDPALVRPSRPVEIGGEIEQITNFNNECLLPVYDVARRDAVAIIRAHPERWLLARVWALNNWVELPKPETTSPLATVVSKLTTLTFAGVVHPPLPSSWPPFWVNHWTLSLTIPVVSVAFMAAAVRRLRRIRREPAPGDAAIVLGGILLAWTFAVGVVFELGEQARFRGPTDPFVLAMTGALALQWFARRRQPNDVPPPDGPSSPSTTNEPKRRVALASAVLVAGIALVGVRDGTATLSVVSAETAAAQIEAAMSQATTTTPASSTSRTSARAPAIEPEQTTSSSALASSTTATPAASPSTRAPAASAPPATLPPVSAPVAAVAATPQRLCSNIVHLGDSNLGMTLHHFQAEYDRLGVPALLDFANGRGADIAVDRTTAREAIAEARASTPDDGRCWVIALSGADAVQAHLQSTDPAPTIRAIADALGTEPVIWIPPVLTSATTEWNLTASTTYDLALADVVAGRSNIFVFDWPSIALQHLDQFQIDGIHYSRELYDLFVASVMDAAITRWRLDA